MESSKLYLKRNKSRKFHSIAVKIDMEIDIELIKFICNKSYIKFVHMCKLEEKNIFEMLFFPDSCLLKGHNS